MSASINFAIDDFKRTAEMLYQKSSRTFPKFVNGQMLKVASEAMRATEKADHGKIERTLGAFYQDKDGKTARIGKRDWQRMEGTFAAKLVNDRRRASGMKTVWGKELADQARKLIAFRKRSAAFIKSGWIPAIRDLSALAYASGYKKQDRNNFQDAKQYGRPKGSVHPAQFSADGRVGCTIINSALLTLSRFSAWNGKQSNPMPVAVSGLRFGIAVADRSMIEELKRRLVAELGKVAS
jgi:hypothetical protein